MTFVSSFHHFNIGSDNSAKVFVCVRVHATCSASGTQPTPASHNWEYNRQVLEKTALQGACHLPTWDLPSRRPLLRELVAGLMCKTSCDVEGGIEEKLAYLVHDECLRTQGIAVTAHARMEGPLHCESLDIGICCLREQSVLEMYMFQNSHHCRSPRLTKRLPTCNGGLLCGAMHAH
eukprot:4929791-Amphidinium_carterae.1